MPHRLAQHLISRGLMPAAKVDEALQRLTGTDATIDSLLLETGQVSEAGILQAMADVSGVRMVNLCDFEPNKPASHELPLKIAQRLGVVPLSVEGNTLHLAVGYPVPHTQLKEVGFLLGKQLELWVSVEARRRDWMAQLYGVPLPPRFGALLASLDPMRKGVVNEETGLVVESVSPELMERINQGIGEQPILLSKKKGGAGGPTKKATALEALAADQEEPTSVIEAKAYAAWANNGGNAGKAASASKPAGKAGPGTPTDQVEETTVLDLNRYAAFAREVSKPNAELKPDRRVTDPEMPAVDAPSFPGGVLPPRPKTQPAMGATRDSRTMEKVTAAPAARPRVEPVRVETLGGVTTQAPPTQPAPARAAVATQPVAPERARPPAPSAGFAAVDEETDFSDLSSPTPPPMPSRAVAEAVRPPAPAAPAERPPTSPYGQAMKLPPPAEPAAAPARASPSARPASGQQVLAQVQLTQVPAAQARPSSPAPAAPAAPAPPSKTTASFGATAAVVALPGASAPSAAPAAASPSAAPTAPAAPPPSASAPAPAAREVRGPAVAAAPPLPPARSATPSPAAPAAVPPGMTAEWTLASARAALKNASHDRELLVDVVLTFGRRVFDYAAAFAVVRGAAYGWDARGEGDVSVIRQVAIPLDAASVMRTVALTRGSYVGPVPPDALTQHYLALLGRAPRTVFLWPVEVKSRLVAIFYGDCAHRPMSQRKLSDFILFCQDLPGAFAELILHRKQRGTSPLLPEAPATDVVAPEANNAAVPDADWFSGLIGLLTGPDPAERLQAMTELLRTPDASAHALATAFPGPTGWSRLPVVELPEADELGPIPGALARLGQSGAAALAPLLDADDSDTRYLALLTAGSVPFAEVVDGVLRGLFDLEPDISSAARAAATALKHEPKFADALTSLRQELLARDPLRRSLAARALGVLHDRESIDTLINLSGSDDALCAQSAAEALKEITRAAFGTQPRQWSSWWAQARDRRRADWLVDALESGDFDSRLSAIDELTRVLGDNLGYLADAEEAERGAAVHRWREFLAEQPQLEV